MSGAGLRQIIHLSARPLHQGRAVVGDPIFDPRHPALDLALQVLQVPKIPLDKDHGAALFVAFLHLELD